MDEKYKEALNRAWVIREDGYKNKDVQETVEYIFPQLKQEKNMKEFIQNELACIRALEDKGSDRYKELTEAIKWLDKEKKEEQVSQSLLECTEKESDEDEKIRNEILEYFLITRVQDFVANPERQKWISYIKKQKEYPTNEEMLRTLRAEYEKGVADTIVKYEQKEQTEELSTSLNSLMQEYVKSGKDEEEQEHRMKCYQLFWDALGDSEFFKYETIPVESTLEYKLGFKAGKESEKQKEQKPRWENNNPHTTKWTEEMIDEKFEELVKKYDNDEKIRKEIIRFLETELELVEEAKYYDSANSIKEWIAYLEKQKSDGKELLYVCDKSYKIGYRDGKLADKWDDLDETYFQDVLGCIEQARKTAKTENDMGTVWAAEHWVKNIIEWKKTKNLMKNE